MSYYTIDIYSTGPKLKFLRGGGFYVYRCSNAQCQGAKLKLFSFRVTFLPCAVDKHCSTGCQEVEKHLLCCIFVTVQLPGRFLMFINYFDS